jgi:hypothetical protein
MIGLPRAMNTIFQSWLTKSVLGMGFAFLMLSMVVVQAQGGFAVSGTFAGYQYKLIAGERLASDNVYATFINNYEVAIDVQLVFEAPIGVTFLVEESIVSIPAGQAIRIPIGIDLADDVVPGDYIISIFAQVLPDQTQGITLIGSAGLNARLSVFGEAGRVNIRSLTTSGDRFTSTIELFRIEDDGRLFSVATAETELSDRVVVGNYVARAYYEGRTISEEYFTVNDNDNLTILLVARTVFIQSFTVQPVFFDDRNVLASATVAYSLENIYEVVNNIKLDLVVRLNGEIVETTEMFLVPVLNPGRTQGRFNYIPRQGWEAGTYTISILLYELDERFENGQFLYDETSGVAFEVPASIVEGGVNILQLALLVISSGLFILMTIFLSIMIKDKYYPTKEVTKAKRVLTNQD